MIREETEFAALMKSLTHRRLPKPSRGAALMNRCFAKLGWSTSTISVEMVRIEENSCDVPDVSLSVADEDDGGAQPRLLAGDILCVSPRTAQWGALRVSFAGPWG